MSSRGLFADEADPWRRKRPAADDIDMTAMIDCTFLLLIFFMVCSTMQSQPDLDLPVATHSQGVDTQTATVITVMAGTAQAGPQILLGDGTGTEAALEEVRGYVTDAVAAGKAQVIVKAEGDVTHGFLEDVLRQVVVVEGAQLFVGVGDQPTE